MNHKEHIDHKHVSRVINQLLLLLRHVLYATETESIAWGKKKKTQHDYNLKV